MVFLIKQIIEGKKNRNLQLYQDQFKGNFIPVIISTVLTFSFISVEYAEFSTRISSDEFEKIYGGSLLNSQTPQKVMV